MGQKGTELMGVPCHKESRTPDMEPPRLTQPPQKARPRGRPERLSGTRGCHTRLGAALSGTAPARGEPPEPGLGRAGPGRCGAAPAASPRLASPRLTARGAGCPRTAAAASRSAIYPGPAGRGREGASQPSCPSPPPPPPQAKK